MKSNDRKKALKFGEFITNAHDVRGTRKARGFVRLAIKPRLIEFRGQLRFVIF
jgi:hypothetical protein